MNQNLAVDAPTCPVILYHTQSNMVRPLKILLQRVYVDDELGTIGVMTRYLSAERRATQVEIILTLILISQTWFVIHFNM